MLRLPLLLAATLCALPAQAFNDVGHLSVAAIAYDQLTPEARTRVKALLKLNPDHADWLATTDANKPSDPEKIIFMRAAYWPDAIKFRDGYKDDMQSWHTAADVTGYADKARHRYWHYKDVAFSTDGTALPKVKTPDAQTQIAKMRALLASSASNDTKSYALTWLIHLVGDVHQPLHAAERYSKDFPKGDGGGNDVIVCTTACVKLHAFWDDAVGATRTHEDPAPKALKVQERVAPFKVDPKAVAITDENVWVAESASLARKFAYASPVGTGTASFKLDQTYRNNVGSVAEKRIALAGARLAKLINDNLK